MSADQPHSYPARTCRKPSSRSSRRCCRVRWLLPVSRRSWPNVPLLYQYLVTMHPAASIPPDTSSRSPRRSP